MIFVIFNIVKHIIVSYLMVNRYLRHAIFKNVVWSGLFLILPGFFYLHYIPNEPITCYIYIYMLMIR